MSKLVKIGGKYGVRKRVPLDIVATFATTKNGKPKEDLWLPLSKDHREAERLRPAAEEDAQNRFDEHRRKLGKLVPVPLIPFKRTPEQVCADFYAALQKHERDRRLAIVKSAKASPAEFWSGDFVDLPPVKARGQDGFHGVLAKAFAMQVTGRLNDAKGALAVMDVHNVVRWLGVLGWTDIDGSLLPSLARTEIAFLEALDRDPAALLNPMQPMGTLTLAAPLQLRAIGIATSKDPKASKAAAEWLKIRIDEGWSIERQEMWREALAVFLEVCGDKPLSAYVVDDKAALQDAYRNLPVSRNKKPETRGKPVAQQIRICAERGMARMNAKTANEYLRAVAKFFDWCKGTYSALDSRNVFDEAALKVPKGQKGKRKDKPRSAFTLDELRLMFANPFYAEHADNACRYWVPLVQLYTGARSNSICRLKVTDIRTKDGVTYFSINDEDYEDSRIKTTDKTEAGWRDVPMHCDLVKLGFLDYVATRKGKEMLFDGLIVSKRGKVSKQFGDWWRRHLTKLGIKAGGRDGKDAHAFRHTWATFALNSRIHEEWRDLLQGHEKQGMRKVYDGPTELQLLDAEMQKLRFDGLDLGHLSKDYV